VEILKFAEPPKRSSRTSTQKRGGLMPLLAVVVSVAVVGGMSTTLAGTINLGTNGTVEFGQGVVTTAACDTSIEITPTSEFKASNSTFFVKSIKLDNIGYIAGGSEGTGCFGKTFTLKAYDSAGTALAMDTGTVMSVSITIPSDSATAMAGTFTKNGDSSFVSVSSPADWNKVSTAGYTQATGTGEFIIGNLGISGTVTKITLESS
jgi:hypothetical protein